MSSNCSEFNDLLLDLAYDELDEVSTARLMAHKHSCAACGRAYDDIMGVRSVAKSIDLPQIPSHFDSDILALARETAQTFKENTTEPPVHAPVNAAPTLSIIEKIQAFVFKPPVFGLGLAAAAVLIAVISLKDKQYSTMLEPEGNPPFVGATKASEQETLPDAATDESKDKASAAEEAVVPPRIQKAGPNYQPGAPAADADDAPIIDAESKKAGGGMIAPAPKKKAAKLEIQKNPADLLGKGNLAAEPDYGSLGATAGATPRSSAGAASSVSSKSSAKRSKEAVAPAATADMAMEEAEMPANTGVVDDSSYFDAGMAAYNRGDCKTAVIQFQKMLDTQSGPANSAATATHYIAKCEKRTGRCGQALISYERVLTQYYGYSKRDEVLYEAAMCHQKLGHNDRAVELLEELALDPQWKSKADAALKSLQK
ncbi:MAG: hypothetical protein JXX29_18065 [Deltaproteobacteria bacterium]|nr:hypothetical protein [Deltaproteobacteria bacterium]MBN2673593.1 hypothetical protein [Deltaproteobacteria bacterium]